jgi:hypothetical protein
VVTCCACAVLAAPRDFKSQKCQIEEAILKASYKIIFYYSFLCELNSIKSFWEAAKQYARANCKYDFEASKRTVSQALDSVPKELITKYQAKTDRIMKAYRFNFNIWDNKV